MLNIGFDAKRFFLNYTGLGNYSRFVINGLSEFVPDNNYILFSPSFKSHPDVDFILARQNVNTALPTGAFRLLKSLWRTAAIGYHPSARSLDIYHGLSHELPLGLPSRTKKVVTLHDLIFLRYPEFYNTLDVAIYKAKAASACSRADVVVAISQQTADDVVEFLKISPDKIKVIYQGCHQSFRRKCSEREKNDIRLRYGLPANFVLSVGTIEQRKNQALIIEALSRIKNKNISLVLVGKATPYIEEIRRTITRLGIKDRIVLIHDAQFNDLPGIYQMASLFVYPSLFEGFGIPIVEAIESGVPVIAGNTSSLREAGGPDSVYVDPGSPDELAFEMNNLLNGDALQHRLTTRSYEYIQRFNPRVIASELDSVYRNLVSR